MRATRVFSFHRRFEIDANAPFSEKCALLKNKFRGRGQFRTSQVEATQFLNTNMGTNLEEWLTVKNAVSSLSVMQFFEIEHPQKAEIAHWLNNKMGSLTVQEKLDVGGVLMGTDHSKYVDTVVANIINPLVRHAVASMGSAELSILCKIMQRCGNSCPTEAWTTVAAHVQRKLTADVNLAELVRFFSGFARRIPESPITLAILRTLVENIPGLKAFDYATVVASAGRLHLTNPLPLDLFSELASHASDYGGTLNARDIGTVLGTIMRARMSYTANAENITELWKVDNTIQVVLHSLSRVVSRFMDPNDERAWSHEGDIVSLVFAFESSGGKFPELFKAFAHFVTTNLRKMEARNIALSLGILRRTGYLTDELAHSLSDRCGVVMDDFNAPELSHVVFTFLAVRGEHPAWIDRAKSRISSLMTAETPVHSRLNIRAAFPGDAALVSNVDLSQIGLRQLHDVLRAPNIDSELRADAERQIGIVIDALEAPSCAEVEVLLDIGRTDFCGLGEKVKETSRKILSRDKWPVDIATLATLLPESERPALTKKAVSSAAAYCESTTQFVSFARTLIGSFPDSIEVRDWIVRGASEIVKPKSGAHIGACLDILDIIHDNKIELGREWYTALLYGPISENATRLAVSSTARVLEMIVTLGVPSSHGEPVKFLLQQGCERAKNAEELVPAFVAAAKLQCAPLDEGWCKQILALPSISDADKELIANSKKVPSSLKSLSRQGAGVVTKVEDAPKKVVVSGANSGGARNDAMLSSFEEDADASPLAAVPVAPTAPAPAPPAPAPPAPPAAPKAADKKEAAKKDAKTAKEGATKTDSKKQAKASEKKDSKKDTKKVEKPEKKKPATKAADKKKSKK